MYDPGIPAGHIELEETDYGVKLSENIPSNSFPPVYLEDDDFLDKYLSFNYKPLSFYLDIGKVRIGY